MLQITPSERSALELLASGAALPRIAGHLAVSEREAEQLLAALLSRMGAAGYAEAVAIAERRGLLREWN